MFHLTRWQVCKLLLQVIFSRDFKAVLRAIFSPAASRPESCSPPDCIEPIKATPSRFEYNAITSRMVQRAVVGFVVLAMASTAYATGSFSVMDPITKLGRRITGGDGIDITAAGAINATGIPAGGVSATTFGEYTTAGGGRATNDRVDAVQEQVTGQAVGSALGATAVQPEQFDNFSTAKGIKDAAQDAAFANHTSSLGSAAYEPVTSFATAAEGALAGTALQSGAPATSIANTPAGSVAATTVQGAINELEDEKGPRSHTITVCAANAFKTTDCDYQCDGIDDQVQFQQAIDSLDASGDYWYGGTIMASVGDFYFSDTATITSSYINIRGQGRGSRFVAKTNNFLFNAEKENKIFDGPFIDGGSKGRYRTNGVTFSDIMFSPDVEYIASASGDGATVTVNTTNPHNLATGQQIWIRSSHANYNTDLYGVFTVTVLGTNQFTIPSTAANFTEMPLYSILMRGIKAIDPSQLQMDKVFWEGVGQAFYGENVFDGLLTDSSIMHSGAGTDSSTSALVLSSAGTSKVAGFKIIGGRIESWGQGAGTQILTTGPNSSDDFHIIATKFESYRWAGDPMLLASYTAAGPTINITKMGAYSITDANFNGGCNEWINVNSNSGSGTISDNIFSVFRNAIYTAATNVFSLPIVVSSSGNLLEGNQFTSRTSSAVAAITLTSGASNNRITGTQTNSTAVPLIADNSGNTTNKIYKNAGADITAVVDGGTGLSSASDDALMVGNGTAWQSKVVPDCDAAGKKLNYDAATNAFTCADEDGASSASSITAGDSSVAVTDVGDGYIAVTEDGTEAVRVTGGSLGVGTTSPNTKLEVVGDISTTEFTYGSELVTNGTFDTDLSGWTTTTGWTYDSGHALHVTGTTSLAQSTVAPTLGKWYAVTFDVGGTFGGGSVQLNFGGIGKIVKSTGGYSYTMSPSSTAALSISVTTDFTGYVDNVSIKEITNGAIYAAKAIGIGTTTPTKSLQIESQGQSSALLRGSTGYGSTIELQHNEVPSSTSSLLGGIFLGAKHTTDTFTNSLEISGIAGGAWTTGSSYPSALVFKTTNASSTSRAERMRIAPDGAVCIGNTTCTGAGNVQAKQFQDTPYAPAAGTSFTVDLANGMDQELTTNGNVTITLPTPVAGKSFTITVKYGGTHTVTWAGGGTIKWANGVAPTATSVSGKYDVYVFKSDATSTYTMGADGGRNF